MQSCTLDTSIEDSHMIRIQMKHKFERDLLIFHINNVDSSPLFLHSSLRSFT